MKDKIKEIILSVNPGMDVEDEDFNIAEDMDSMDILALMEELVQSVFNLCRIVAQDLSEKKSEMKE